MKEKVTTMEIRVESIECSDHQQRFRCWPTDARAMDDIGEITIGTMRNNRIDFTFAYAREIGQR